MLSNLVAAVVLKKIITKVLITRTATDIVKIINIYIVQNHRILLRLINSN